MIAGDWKVHVAVRLMGSPDLAVHDLLCPTSTGTGTGTTTAPLETRVSDHQVLVMHGGYRVARAFEYSSGWIGVYEPIAGYWEIVERIPVDDVGSWLRVTDLIMAQTRKYIEARRTETVSRVMES